MAIYRNCKCGLPIYNKVEFTCVTCKREAEFERLARVIRDPSSAADSIRIGDGGYRRTRLSREVE